MTSRETVKDQLLKACEGLYDRGISVDVNVLMREYPGHSKRDYYIVLDAWNERMAALTECCQALPPSCRQKLEQFAGLMWTSLKEEANQQIAAIKSQSEQAVREARTARDQALRENESLQQRYTELLERFDGITQTLESKIEENTKLHDANQDFQVKIALLNQKVDGLTRSLSTSEANFQALLERIEPQVIEDPGNMPS